GRYKMDEMIAKYPDEAERARHMAKAMLARAGLKMRTDYIDRRGENGTRRRLHLIENLQDAEFYLEWRFTASNSPKRSLAQAWRENKFDKRRAINNETMQAIQSMTDEQRQQLLMTLIEQNG